MEKNSGQTIMTAIAAMLLIAYADAHTTHEVSLWPLYIGPVVAISWQCGFVHGVLSALGCAGLLMVSASFSGHPYSSTWLFGFATLCQLAALLTIAWLAARLASTESLLLKLMRAWKN